MTEMTAERAFAIDWWQVKQSVWLRGWVLFFLSLVPLVYLIFATPGFVSTDDYYHARLSAEIIEQRRLAVDFPWLPRTLLSQDRFVDHHLLFHLYLAPWMALGGMAGAKLATAVVAAGVAVAAWVMLRGVGVRFPMVWAAMLFGLSSPFLYRLLMVRTQGASLLLLILALHVLFQKRYRLLLPLGFAYAWLYNGFVLLPAFAALYMLARWLDDRTLEWRPPVYAAAGVALGLLINPYFPHNVQFIMEHLGAKTDLETGVPVGSEWYAYQTSALLDHSPGAMLALALGVLGANLRARRADSVSTTLLLVALLTLYMLFRSRRFIEYYPAFALLFCAVAWGRGQIAPETWLPRHRLARLPVIAGLGGLVLLLTAGSLTGAARTIRDAEDVHYMAGAAGWLAANTPAGAMVFQTDWDDFPYLFYHNTHNVYLVGMDPTYLERADSELWDLWVAITRGEIDQPSVAIQRIFGADYAVSDTRHRAFAEKARNDSGMQLVYRDETSLVWEITGARP